MARRKPYASLFVPKQQFDDWVERFNLRRVWYWMGLSSIVGVIGGAAALAFAALTDFLSEKVWGDVIGYLPPRAGGESAGIIPGGNPNLILLTLMPAVGCIISAFLVRRFAPDAKGHGTDAAIKAFHHGKGVIGWKTPITKLFASAVTIATGGSAGREGPIAQISAGFGSIVGGFLKLSARDRRVLMAAGLAAGVGATFRAPFAGAIFAAEVLYREPDIEADVVVPALLSSIVSYTLFCSVHGFGHLFSGTSGFAFVDPRSLGVYAILGFVVAAAGALFAVILQHLEHFFENMRAPWIVRALMGGVCVGGTGALLWLLTREPLSLSAMGTGYGIVQTAMSVHAPALLWTFLIVAIAKIILTSITIACGGSGGVFGPSMVIGGCLGAFVGSAFHLWMPDIVPEVGPFALVGMAGFFGGIAKTPISTLLMVGDLSGNYSLLLPSMLVVGMAFLMTHRWTLYTQQVPTRANSPAHKGDFTQDILADLTVGGVYDKNRVCHSVQPHASLGEIMTLVTETAQLVFPVVDSAKKPQGIFSLADVRQFLYRHEMSQLIVAEDLATHPEANVGLTDSLQKALDILTLADVSELPVVDETNAVVGLLSRRDIIAAYNRRLLELKSLT